MYNLAIIGGDGIGREVMSACEYLLDKIDLEFSFEYGEAGFECFNKNGSTLPEETIKIAKEDIPELDSYLSKQKKHAVFLLFFESFRTLCKLFNLYVFL